MFPRTLDNSFRSEISDIKSVKVAREVASVLFLSTQEGFGK